MQLHLINGQQQSVTPWDNGFILKTLLFLMISGLIEGYDLGVTAFMNLKINDRYFLSLSSLGSAFGALFSGPIVDKWGRRSVVIMADLLYLMGGVVMTFYNYEHWVIYAGRFIVGLATGVTSMNVPIYISEVVPNEVRGRFVAWYAFLIVAGQLLANVMALILINVDFIIIIFWIGELFVLIQILGLVFVIPESPRWLAKNGQTSEANKVLDKVYKPEYVEVYKRSLSKEIGWMRNTNQLPLLQQYKVLFLKYSRLILIGCGLMICQQVSGIVIAVQYGPILIENAGFKTADVSDEVAALILSLPLSFVQMLGTIIAITVIDTRGRRKVLLKTLPIIFLCMATAGASFAAY